MVVLDDLKNLVMYKKNFFLPIDEKDKRHNSAIMLLTPNYQSSLNCMTAPYTINRKWFESYYLERNIYKYISSKGGNIEDDPIEEFYIQRSEDSITLQEYDNIIDEFKEEINKEFALQERVLLNEDDIYYNKDKFDSGEINLCFITGHSGSGKSTMGRSMQGDKIEHYELDDLSCVKDHFSMDNLKEYGDLIYSYFKGPGKRFYITFKELEDKKIPSTQYEDIMYPEFVKYAMQYAKLHKDRKYVIEGVWLFENGDNGSPMFQPEQFKDYAFYIKGTSMIVSKYRAVMRDSKDNNKPVSRVFNSIRDFAFKNWKWYNFNEKQINRFRDYFKKLMVINNESAKYDPPMSYTSMVSRYGRTKADELMKDPVHQWRASNGIELIHKEPSIEELNRIWANWQLMPDNMKRKSDEKSIELYGVDNETNYNNLVKQYYESALNEIYVESYDASKLDKNFKKKTGINFDIISIRDSRVKGYVDEIKGRYKDYFTGYAAFEKGTNKFAGFIRIWPDWIMEGYHGNMISPLEVKPEYRGYGLGNILANKAIKELDANLLFVAIDNEVAINMYKNLGFSIVDTILFKNEKYYIMTRPSARKMNESASLLESCKDFTELEICSGLIVDSKKKVVFQCHKKDGSITFPGGKKERGESDLETLKRELKEELGIKVVSAKKLYDFTYGYNYPDDSKDYVITDHLFLIEEYQNDIKNLEPQNHKWVKFVALEDILMEDKNKISKPVKRFIAQYGARINNNPNEFLYKYAGTSNIVYTGYESDVQYVKKFINKDSFERVFKHCGLKYDKKKRITIIVSQAKNDFGYIDEENITVLAKSVYNTIYDGMEYETYLLYMQYIYAYTTHNPDIQDNIVHPLALYKTGVHAKQLADPKETDPKYDMEKIFKHVYEEYGDRAILEIVKDNKIGTLLKYTKDMIASSIPFIESVRYYLQEEDNPTTQPNDDSKGYTISDLDKIMSNNPAKKIISRIKRKMNKIARDIKRGNAGTDSKTKTTLQQLDQLGKIDTPTLPSGGSAPTEEEYILWTNGECVVSENCIFFLEDANPKYDPMLKKILYQDRLRTSRQVLDIYKMVKAEAPFIRYTYIKPEMYKNRNLFFDLSYYNESYFRHVGDVLRGASPKKAMEVYTELLKRMIDDERFSSYKKKTIFIPVLDWNHNNSTKMWMYRNGISPISIIYELILNHPSDAKKLFKGIDIVFMGPKNYFKLSLDKVDISKDKVILKMRTLISRLITLGFNSPADPDPEDEQENSPKGIALDIVDKVEKSQNVEINDVSPIMKHAKNSTTIDGFSKSTRKVSKNDANIVNNKIVDGSNTTAKTKKKAPTIDTKTAKEEDKAATGISSTDNAVNAKNNDKEKETLTTMIAIAASDSNDTDDALSKLDDDFIKLVNSIKEDDDKNIKVIKARASALVDVSDKIADEKINNITVRELLKENPNDNELPKTELKIASINDSWKNMQFMNFDKTYNPDSDIMKMLDNMKNWSYPIAVTDINVTDTSTADDYIDTWVINCKDYKKERFTLKIDVPKFIDDKFLMLRGNKKALMIQSTMMPIVKTDLDTCQVIGVGGYNKIFIRRYGSSLGRSINTVDKLIRSLGKYTGKEITTVLGDNTTICNKYELPIDYIDLASYYSIIETPKVKIYFDQDALRKEYSVDDNLGIPIGILKKFGKEKEDKLLYYGDNEAIEYGILSQYLVSLIIYQSDIDELIDIYNNILISGKRYTYSRANILNSKIPIVMICGYLEGLTRTLTKGNIEFSIEKDLPKSHKYQTFYDYIKFKDGYLRYKVSYTSSLLMNGLKECDTEDYSLKDMNSREMYMNFLNDKIGSLKADGLDNSYDLMLDPITKEILSIYKLPTDYVSVLLYANKLLADNKFVKHVDMSVRRFRRKELIAGYFYRVLSSAYEVYANSIRHSRRSVKMSVKRSALIDMILSKDPSTNDLSINNAINDIECANTITNKGLVGMNLDRSYSLDKRGYDRSMSNVLGMSTGFSANVGVNRQATINANIQGARGFVKTNTDESNSAQLDTVNSLTITEALTPFGTTHDDPTRTLMTFVQTSKHMVRTDVGDPLLVTNGSDEAMPYLVSNIFAFKAKNDGVVKEIVIGEKINDNSYMVIEYKDGTNDIVNLAETIEKNSDGGYSVPMKLDTDLKVGAKVKAGEILAYDKKSFSNTLGESKNLALNIGTLAKVAIMNTDEGFEDSAAITEDFGKLLGTDVITTTTKTLGKNSNVFLLKKPGDPIVEGETIMSYQTSYDDDVANSLLKNLNMGKEEVSELGKNPIKSDHTGILEGIKVYRTVEMDELSPSLQELVKMYEKPINAMKSVYKKYGINPNKLPSTNKVESKGKTKNVEDGVLIEFYIKYKDNMGLGDKIVFYSANKGIIKYMIPEGEEPYTEFRPNEKIDAFVSIGSINGRMVCSTPLFGSISKLMVELDRSCKDIAGIPYGDRA